ncbi:hypothetical protein NC652_021923 [Populus alba x Populus x berolinensis]|uniref:Uncharacterized protein n=1 Tax=Populus alba x Populus x berolinensis TaxID=444605 RepID=A0AAD6QE32_9ROSI|nr:hypothetical protein NC652_021923 [Populus alba x Populus x berolinensis]KAJ6988852.1 hypothetical protein NC653_021685 [Populus alba x Populus x berolinensis]
MTTAGRDVGSMGDREGIGVKVERDQQGRFKRGFKREGHGRERSTKKRKKKTTMVSWNRSLRKKMELPRISKHLALASQRFAKKQLSVIVSAVP